MSSLDTFNQVTASLRLKPIHWSCLQSTDSCIAAKFKKKCSFENVQWRQWLWSTDNTEDGCVLCSCAVLFCRSLPMLQLVFVTLTMEAASIAETSVNFYQTTRRNIPEDGHLHTRLRENPISYISHYFPSKFLPPKRFLAHLLCC
jgi:hypothetical protein